MRALLVGLIFATLLVPIPDAGGAAAVTATAASAAEAGAVPTGAVLSGAVLSGAVPTGAVLSGAVLSGAVPTGAVLSGEVLSGSVRTDDAETVTVTLDEFELTCVAEMTEGQSYQCSLKNTGTEEAEWPTVGLMHSSDDSSRALVAGSPIDVELGSPLTSSDILTDNWWIGSVLIGFSRFDWSEKATAEQTKQFTVSVNEDDEHETAETFYIGMIASESKNMTAMFNNKQAITVAASDSASTDATLSSIDLLQGSTTVPVTLSEGVTSYSVTAGYEVTELGVMPVASDDGASVSVNGTQLERPEAGPAGVVLALPVGVTTVTIVVTAADQATQATYTVGVTRQAHADGDDAGVVLYTFTLSCPHKIWEGLQHACSLTNTAASARDWPAVGIVHSSLDTDRALVAADSLIGESDAAYSRDVRLWPETAAADDALNYGYGELFAGGIVSARVVYGYQQVDLGGQAEAGEERWVFLAADTDDDSSSELFYVTLGQDQSSSLAELVAERTPVLVAGASETAPAADSVAAADVSYRTARASVTLARAGQGALAVFVRWRPSDGDADAWTTASVLADGDSATQDLDSLASETTYTVQASLHQDFPEDATVSATFETASLPLDGVGVSGTTLTLAFNLPLSQSSTPAAGDFSVNAVDAVSGVSAALPVSSVAIAESTVTLTLSTPPRAGDTVTLDYTPGTNPIRFEGGTDAADLDDQAVANTTQRSSDAVLSGLSLSGVVLVPGFSSGVVSYTASAANVVSVVSVSAVAADGRAVVEVLPVDADPVAGGHQVALSVGSNDVTVTVTAEDTTTTRAYTVSVLRAANSAPVFGSSVVSRQVAENSGGGVVLGLPVVADDVDEGQTLRYSLGGSAASLFAVDAASGQISTVAGAGYDFESKTQYSLTVTAADDGTPSASASVGVTVSVVNVAEVPSVPVPRVVGATRDSVTVQWDPSSVGGGPAVSGYDVRYRVAGSSGSWLAGAQDVEATSATVDGLSVNVAYEFQVLASNADGDSVWSSSVTATTPRSSDAVLSGLSLSGVVLVPGFSSGVVSYTASAANVVSVVSVSAVAADGRAVVEVLPVDADPVAGGHQVALSVGSNDVTVTVTAEDTTTTRAYTVSVLRAANSAPVFGSSVVSRQVAENSGGGVVLGLPVVADDVDEGQTLRYSLGGSAASLFAVDAASGQISTVAGAGYDFESKTQYSLTVTAADDGTPSASASVGVTVSVVNVAEVPSVPVPRVVGATRDSVTVQWDPSSVGGGPAVSGYDVRYRVAGSSGSWLAGAQDVEATSATVDGLSVNVAYEFQVLASNADGDSVWSSSVTATTPRSSDAVLSGLSLSGVVLVPGFSSGVVSYTASAANVVSVVSVSAVAADGRAVVEVLPVDADPVAGGHQVALSVGSNDVTVTVTAEDTTTTRAYTVSVVRLQETVVPTLLSARLDADELVLTYDEALDESSIPPVGAFTVRVTDSATSVRHSAPVESVTIDADTVVLALGTSARHGDTATLDYTEPATGPVQDRVGNPAAGLSGWLAANTTAASSDATLSSLALSGIALGEEFSPTRLRYTADVPGLVSTTTVTALRTDPRATVSTLPEDDAPAGGHQVSLAAGPNIITVTVVAEDGNTMRAYTARATRHYETAAPLLETAVADGAELVLTYDEPLHEASTPPAGAYAVRAQDAVTSQTRALRVTGVTVSADTVVVALDAEIRRGDTVTADYTAPATAPVEDTSGNDAMSFDAVAVTNVTAASADASLAALSVSGVTLQPRFSPDTYRYDATASEGLDQATVTAAAAGSRAAAEIVEPADALADVDGSQAAISVGINTISVRVTAEDSVSSRIYSVAVTRPAPRLPPQPAAAVQPEPPALTTVGSRARGDSTAQAAEAGQQGARAARAVVELTAGTVEAGMVGASWALLDVGADGAEDGHEFLVRYRPSAAAGSVGWASVLVAATGGAAQARLVGLDPSTEYTVHLYLHRPVAGDPDATATFTTSAAASMNHTQDEFTLTAQLFIYAHHDGDYVNDQALADYDVDKSPTPPNHHFDMITVSFDNIEAGNLGFDVHELPDESSYQFCWRRDLNRGVTEPVCGDLLIGVRPSSGWLHVLADTVKPNDWRRARAWHYLFDYEPQRMTFSAADSESGLKVFHAAVVHGPTPLIDCSDYPDKDRLRFNCLLNGERLPPPPDVDNDAELLDDSLQLVYDEDDYDLVFREEFESTSGMSHCENLAALRPSVWSIGINKCGYQDADGNHCEGVADGAYLMSISKNCGPDGLKTGGKFAFRYGYFETKFTMRFQNYVKFTNSNIVLGDARVNRKYWLHDYGIDINSAESQLTNLAHEVDFFECVDTNGLCIWHSYFNVGGYIRREGTTRVDGYSTASAIKFCYGEFGQRVNLLGGHCSEPYDFNVTITLGLEWTPRGYRHSYRVEESGRSFIVSPQSRTFVYRWVDGDRRVVYGEDKDAFFEEFIENDTASVLEQIGIAHVPLHIEIGTWQQGLTDEQATNDVKIEIDYIRLYQPENGYADMEPVYQ